MKYQPAIWILALLCLSTGVFASGSSPDVEPNMMIYYHFNQNATVGENTTNVYDYSPSAKNGTLVGATINTTGGFFSDGEVSFFGSDDYVTIAGTNTGQLNASFQNFTVVAWIKPRTLISQSTVGRFIEKRNHFSFYMSNATGTVSFDTFGLGDNSISALNNLTTNTWTHVAFTYNGSRKAIFVNGILRNSETTTGNITSSGTTNVLVLGARPGLLNNFNGSMDEFIIYNRTLSDAEIHATYQNYVECFNATDGMAIQYPTRLCQNTYYLNGSTGGAISLTKSSASLDCQNSAIVGNNSNNLVGIYSSTYSNISIRNCFLYNYSKSISVRNNQNVTIENVSTFGDYGFLLLNTNNSILQNMRISLRNSTKTAADVGNIYSVTFTNITVSGVMDTGIYFSGLGNNITITDSIFNNISQQAIRLRDNTVNVVIQRTLFNFTDTAVFIDRTGHQENITIRDSIITNTYMNGDTYDAGIRIEAPRGNSTDTNNLTNLFIINNTFSEFGCVGIAGRNVINAQIINNTFSQNISYLLSESTKIYGNAQSFNCRGQPLTAIYFGEFYKGYLPAGTQTTDNATIAANHYSDRINISDNNFSNVNVYLHTQGALNVTYDFTDAWQSKFKNTLISGKQELHINPIWSNVSTIYPSGTLNSTVDDGVVGNWTFAYTITKTGESFKNLHSSPREISFYDVLVGYAYLSNGSVVQENASLIGYNLTLNSSPSSTAYLIKSSSISEVSPPSFSAITTSRSSVNTVRVTSSIIEAISSLSFNVSLSGVVPSSPTFTSSSGTSSSLSYTSTGGYLNTSPVEIPPGTSVLELRGGYGEFIPADAVCNSGMNTYEKSMLFMGVIGAFVIGVVMILLNGISPTSILLLSISIVMMGVALNAICW